MLLHSIRTKILLSFFLLITFISIALLYSQYYFSKKTAYETTENTFLLIANNIASKQNDTKVSLERMIHTTLQNPNIYKPITENIYHPFLTHLIYLINNDNSIYAIYFTQNKNKMYELINITHFAELFRQLHAPNKTKWVVLIYKDDTVQYTFLDQQQHILSTYTSNEKYNIEQRPWYTTALNSNKIVCTSPYVFHQLQKTGFTYSIALKNHKSVFAIDYTLEDLQKYLQKQKLNKASEIFIFNAKGDILSSSNTQTQEHQKSVDSEFLKLFSLNNEKKVLTYSDNNRNYYTIYKKIANNLYLGMKFPLKVLIAPHLKNLLYSFGIALIFIFLALLYIYYATKKIVSPIEALIQQNKKIKKRDFGNVGLIQTDIVEFNDLSHSLVDMAHSISAYQKAQKELLDSIVKLIAEAIDSKSSYTGGHCERVPLLATMLLEAANSSKDETFKNFQFKDKDSLEAFRLGAWLHDCGKVTTPEYVVDKATKLETIYNRIHEIRTRFELLWRDAEIKYFKALLADKNKECAHQKLQKEQDRLKKDFNFIAQINLGGEYMTEEAQTRIRAIGSQEWLRHLDDRLGLSDAELQRYDTKYVQEFPIKEQLLSDKKEHIILRENFDYKSYKDEGFKEEVPKYLYNHGEIYNLCIEKGTLSAEERYKINEHVIMSIKMLEKIPFPQHLKKVPEYAGTHHETLIGTGYPRKLSANQLSIPSRIMAIADIFEALTASDRPYKKAKTLSQALKIMSYMVIEQHIDAELFKLFLESGIYLEYAKKFLKKEQLDKIDIKKYLS